MLQLPLLPNPRPRALAPLTLLHFLDKLVRVNERASRSTVC